MEVMDMLDRLYVEFDALSNTHGLFKVPLEQIRLLLLFVSVVARLVTYTETK